MRAILTCTGKSWSISRSQKYKDFKVTQRDNNQKKSKTRNLESMKLYCIVQSKVL